MLQSDDVAYCFSLTHELPGVEFKGLGYRRDNPLFGKVMRAAMGMANRRGGGMVIVGVSEHDNVLSFDGLTSEQLATWKYDSIAGALNSHTSVPIEFDRLEHQHDGKTFLVLGIHEFASTPVMCVREYRDQSNPNIPPDQRPIILRAGAFYMRTLNNPETKEMLTGEMARALFDLATEKGIRSFVTQTRLAGIQIAPLPEDKELFARQLQGWTGDLLNEILSRGHWDVRICPVTFQQDRVPLYQLYPLLMQASLNYGPWEFPYITPAMPAIGNDWIGLEYQREYWLQAWRFFQSGQFAARVGFQDDWGDKLTFPPRGDMTPGVRLSIPDVVFRFSEIFGLASRLATKEVYRDERSMVIEVTLCNVRGRTLYDRGAWNVRPPVSSAPTAADDIPYPPITLAKEDVIARPKELAREAARYIFERFGYHPSDQLLATIQSELRFHT